MMFVSASFSESINQLFPHWNYNVTFMSPIGTTMLHYVPHWNYNVTLCPPLELQCYIYVPHWNYNVTFMQFQCHIKYSKSYSSVNVVLQL